MFEILFFILFAIYSLTAISIATFMTDWFAAINIHSMKMIVIMSTLWIFILPSLSIMLMLNNDFYKRVLEKVKYYK